VSWEVWREGGALECGNDKKKRGGKSKENQLPTLDWNCACNLSCECLFFPHNWNLDVMTAVVKLLHDSGALICGLMCAREDEEECEMVSIILTITNLCVL
jgi:hypothetical protein